jgi:hypothetical protein
MQRCDVMRMIVLAAMFVGLAACGPDIPGCSDPRTKELVQKGLKDQPNSLAGEAGVRLRLDDITTMKTEPTVNTCDATLVLQADLAAGDKSNEFKSSR